MHKSCFAEASRNGRTECVHKCTETFLLDYDCYLVPFDAVDMDRNVLTSYITEDRLWKSSYRVQVSSAVAASSAIQDAISCVDQDSTSLHGAE